MKTHSARWAKNSSTTWTLNERARDGGAVLATIRDAIDGVHWLAEIGDERILCNSRYAAQRACRAALAGGGEGKT